MRLNKNVVGRRIAAAVIVTLVSVGVVACGAGSGNSGSGSGQGPADPKLYTHVPTSGCGSEPSAPAIDPEGVVASLPKAQQAPYESYPYPNLKSGWANFKGKKPPYTVGLNLVPPVNDFMTRMNTTLVKELKQSPEVGKIVTRSTPTITDVVGQLANFDGLLREHPDVIITVAIQPGPFEKPVDRAAKQGVPVVTLVNAVPSKYALNVQHNPYQSIAKSTATMMRLLGGKGNTVWVNGIPGDVSTDIGLKAYDAVIKRCPNVKNIGQIYGSYLNATAERETLKFLATHPQNIAGVAQAASMGTGIMQAFLHSGRPMPVVQESAGQQGSLGYWRHHPDYRGTGFGVSPSPIGRTSVNVALRTLEGQGPKINNLVGFAKTITPANLNDWAEPQWTLASTGTADGPNPELLDDNYLNTLFTRGAPPK